MLQKCKALLHKLKSSNNDASPNGAQDAETGYDMPSSYGNLSEVAAAPPLEKKQDQEEVIANARGEIGASQRNSPQEEAYNLPSSYSNLNEVALPHPDDEARPSLEEIRAKAS